MKRLNLILISTLPVGLLNIILQLIMYFLYGSISPEYWSETTQTIMLYYALIAPALVIVMYSYIENKFKQN